MSSMPEQTTESPIVKNEELHFSGELEFANELVESGIFDSSKFEEEDQFSADRIRRKLLTTHIRLSKNIAPEIYEYAAVAQKALNLTTPMELYQASGDENAANWMCPDVVFISLQGRLTSLLDRPTFIALLGHEFGHHLAHTFSAKEEKRGLALMLSAAVAYDNHLPETIRKKASRLCMAKEFTADRYSAIAAGALDGPLRLLMTLVTGLPSERLKEDASAYLDQARALFEDQEKAETTTLGSHPEHLLRAYALSLFVETDLFLKITGEGPGTRTVKEVDQVLKKILVGDEERIYEIETDSALSPEMQEYSLCAASLMAMADGHLDDSEAKTLEDTFSDVVPNWKVYLDQEVAIERYRELLPIAVAGGIHAAETVFNVLMHVMMVDREIHVNELEMLSAVGRSLQQEHLFDFLLKAVLRKNKFEQAQTPVAVTMPSLPPGRHEAQTALNGLFSGVSKRGGGTVSLRRILRIVGKKEWDDSILPMIETILPKFGLSLKTAPFADPDGGVSLDQSIDFRLTEEERKKREEAEREAEANRLAEAKTKDALMVALKQLRERLVSGDGRSPSIRLYKARTGRHFDLAELDRVVSGRSERIVALLREQSSISLLNGDEAGGHKAGLELARDLRYLEREFRARIAETGSKDMFVGYPFLTGKVDGFFFRAPLILHPFSLISDSRGAGSYQLKRREGDEPVANQALVRLLFVKKNYSFTDELGDDLDAKASENDESLLDALKQVGFSAEGLSGVVSSFEDMTADGAALLSEGISISEQAVVGFFPQSNSDLLQDYDDLLEKLDTSSSEELEHALNSASEILPAEYRPKPLSQDEEADPDQPIVFSDPSQREAVINSRGARLMVMDGPPGTGKSQTIVNLIADALARGERAAVVCEKRVALDVVKQRMDAAGIGHLAAVVHDVHDDRKGLYTHIADRLEAEGRADFDDSALKRWKDETEDIEKRLSARDEVLCAVTDSGLTVGQLHAMATAYEVSPCSLSSLITLNRESMHRLALGVKEAHGFSRFWKKDSIFRGEPDRKSLAGETSDDFHRIQDELSFAATAVKKHQELSNARPMDPSALASAESALNQAASIMETIPDPATGEMFGRMVNLRLSKPEKIDELEDWLAEIESQQEAVIAEEKRVKFEAGNEFTAAMAIANKKCTSIFRGFAPSWWRAKKAIRAVLAEQWPEQAAAKIKPPLLGAIKQRINAAIGWQKAEAVYKTFHMHGTMPRKAEALLDQLESLRSWWASSGALSPCKPALVAIERWWLPTESAQPAQSFTAWAEECRAVLLVLDAQRKRDSAMEPVLALFPNTKEFSAEQMKRLAVDFENECYALSDADRIVAQMEEVFPDTIRILEMLSDLETLHSQSDWADSVRRGWAEAWIAESERRVPNLKLLDQLPPLGSLEKASERLLELHTSIAREEARRIYARSDQEGLMAIQPAAPRVRRSQEQAIREAIIREARKKRCIMPMRSFVRKFSKEGLLDVVPVWLMSPETTAILFPRKPVFDLLIVDEASQCTVENGFPVLTRSLRSVVAGDDKQMPPTSFFKAAVGIDMEETDGDDGVPKDVFEAESLLVLARRVGYQSPLCWHYRSLYEELIAFSNHSMYGGSLLTIPSTLSRAASPKIRWEQVEDGTWEKGVNVPEAKKVVDIIDEILSRPKKPTIGVVTFNILQRRMILDEIDDRCAKDEGFAERYGDAMDQELLDARPFVKNLESVQGDERDVIIFSLGYAPVKRYRKDGTEETYVPARFGPLGLKGGERRLNVAVSRAKAEIVVVSSFFPSMLSVAHTKHDGPRLFKAFVEFAYHMGEKRRNQADKILSLVNDLNKQRFNPKEAKHAANGSFLPLYHQIALELEKEGIAVETQVGSSEFHLPIAVVHPENHKQYILAVLCDDGNSNGSTYERYVHIPNVLRHRSWQYIRVNSREWHRDRVRVIDRIRKANSDVLAAGNNGS